MIRHLRLEHQFVEHFPEPLQPGVLYVSIEYGSAAHSCCCGCGEEVVTPITPTDWKMTYDGESISLWPSIGNWKLRCRSHYVIERGRVIESIPWTDAQIAAEHRRDKAAKAVYFGTEKPASSTLPVPTPSARNSDRLWFRLSRWLASFWR